MTRLFTIHEVDELTPVQFVGVLPLHWRANWGVPTVMFAEVDDPVYDAAPELLEACKATRLFLSDQDARDDMSDAGYARYDDVVDALDAAIAKAAPECDECGGTGTVIVTSSPGFPEHGSIEQESCPKCNGKGTR